MTAFDPLIVGGGINGTGIARDAAGRGMRLLLLRLTPHLVRRQRPVIPHEHRLGPAWAVRLGLFLYDQPGG